MKLCVCAAILSRNTDCYMVVIWLLYDCYMIVIWLLYGCYTHFAHICKHPLATVRFFWLKVVSCSFVLGPWPPTLRSGPQPLLPRATWGSVQLELQGHQPRPHPPAEKARTPLALRVLLATWPKSIPISIVQRRLLDLSYLPQDSSPGGLTRRIFYVCVCVLTPSPCCQVTHCPRRYYESGDGLHANRAPRAQPQIAQDT